MHVAITLCMDARSSDKVASIHRFLRDGGISDYGLRLGYRPHLTLLRYDGLEPDALLPIVSQLAPSIPPLNIRLEGLALFPGASPALWLAPATNAALVSLHGHLHAALARYVAEYHYQPGRWVPHVTLAEGLDRVGALRAIATILPTFSPIEGELDRIDIVKSPPTTVVWSRRTGDA